MNRVFRQMRVGDMALHALDHEFARERTASAILDGVAKLRERCWFADDAEVHRFATRRKGFDDGNGAVHGIALFIRSEQEGN